MAAQRHPARRVAPGASRHPGPGTCSPFCRFTCSLRLLHGIPLLTSAGWFVTNTSEALLGAFLLRRLRVAARAVSRHSPAFFSSSRSPSSGPPELSSFLDAAVVVLTGTGQGYWDVWCHRFASNALAMLTLVPPIVTIGSSSFTRFRAVPRSPLSRRRTCSPSAALFVDESAVRQAPDAQASIPGADLHRAATDVLGGRSLRPDGVSILQLFSTSSHALGRAGSAVAVSDDVLPLQMFLLMLNGLSLSLAVVVHESRRLQSLHSAVLQVDAQRGGDHRFRWRRASMPMNPGLRPLVHADPCRLDGVGLHANYSRAPPHECAARFERRDACQRTRGRCSRAHESCSRWNTSCRTGDDTKWFSISVVPLWGDQRGAVITHTDITSRKREEAETLQLREELAHAGRVMTMGMLSASLTHEMSQPLAAILANAQAARRLSARMEPGDSEEVDVILADVVAASRRAGSILQRLRSWFSNGRHERERLGLNEVANDVIEILRGDLLRRGVTVSRRLSPRASGDHRRSRPAAAGCAQPDPQCLRRDA